MNNDRNRRTRFALAAALLLVTIVCAAPAQPLTLFRGGVQVGLSAERSTYSWTGSDATVSSVVVDARQNGFLGIALDFPLSSALLLEFAPHYGQRNVPIATLQRRGGVNFTILQDPVDYIGVPVIAKYLLVERGLLLPYAGVGVEFGMNLSSLHVTVEEYRFSGEPLLSSTVSFRRNLNQLFGAVLAEVGLDIRAADAWSVLLGVRYSHELTPLVDDPLLTWNTPHSWKVRFTVLYTFGGGS
jgi:outer membrane protein W